MCLTNLIRDAIAPCAAYAFRRWLGTPDRPAASAGQALRRTASGTREPASAPASRAPRRFAHRIACSARRPSSGIAERAAGTPGPCRVVLPHDLGELIPLRLLGRGDS